jgi:hypothetical protein
MPAAPCRPGVPSTRTIPLRRFLRPTTPRPWSRRPCGFRASRLVKGDVTSCAPFVARNEQVEAPPARVIRGWCSSNSARSGPAPGLFSRPGRGDFRLPGDVHGICRPFAVLSRPAGERASSASRAHVPFRLAVHREFPRRGTPLFGAGRRTLGRGSWALAPGVSRAVSSWRPRHGLPEQGRPGAPAGTALGFVVLSRVFGRRPLAAASGGLPPVGFSPRGVATLLQTKTGHVAASGGPFGVVRGRRLAGPAVRSPPVPASPSEVFAPSAAGVRLASAPVWAFPSSCRRMKGVRDVSFRGLGAGRNEPLTEL